MDRRFLTVLGVSLVFALVVSSVFYQMTSRSGSAKPVNSTDTRDMVVATRPLGVGVMVKPADVKIAKITAEGFPKGAFSKVEEVLDRPVISNMLLEEPIMEGRLAPKGSGLGLAPTIPADARGQAIQAPTVTILATPDQAETLTLANSEGRIQLVLRNSSDQTIETTPG